MRPRHALVIGKFYPPHAGHHLLVRAAAAQAERVTVVVMSATVESIPLAPRLEWMREVHASDPNVTVVGTMDEVKVDLHDGAVWAAHVALMRAAVEGVTALPVDAVFTSEAYGDELARRFGARHVSVDLPRAQQPVSGTQVRADPVGHWHHLAPCVRAWFTRRVVLVGAESTGKSTLALALAAALAQRGGPFAATAAVEEYGRRYTLEKLAASGGPLQALRWDTPDFVAVAREQNALEDAAARRAGPVLVCDTDAFATGLWHARYVGARSPEVEALGRAHPLYLLTHPEDVPFTQDGLRDGEHLRAWMTGAFEERLRETGRRWEWLRGDRPTRLARALGAVDRLLAGGWQLAAPLG